MASDGRIEAPRVVAGFQPKAGSFASEVHLPPTWRRVIDKQTYLRRSMTEKKALTRVVVTNPQGLHARPADMFVKCAMQFESRIEIIKQSERFDGKSILEILALAAVQGTELSIEAVGADADAALKALTRLFERDFAEEEDVSGRQGGLT